MNSYNYTIPTNVELWPLTESNNGYPEEYGMCVVPVSDLLCNNVHNSITHILIYMDLLEQAKMVVVIFWGSPRHWAQICCTVQGWWHQWSLSHVLHKCICIYRNHTYWGDWVWWRPLWGTPGRGATEYHCQLCHECKEIGWDQTRWYYWVNSSTWISNTACTTIKIWCQCYLHKYRPILLAINPFKEMQRVYGPILMDIHRQGGRQICASYQHWWLLLKELYW